MKKLITLVLLTVSASAFADWHHGGHHNGGYHRGGGWGWGPVLGGAVAGAVIYDIYKRPVVVQQPPVVVQQQPVVVQQQQPQNCTPWTETQTPDGKITRTRTCTQ
jgi:hypothetical protein